MKKIVFHIDSILTRLPAICRLLTRNDFCPFTLSCLLSFKGYSTADIPLEQIEQYTPLAFNDFIITDYQDSSPELLQDLDREHFENYHIRY